MKIEVFKRLLTEEDEVYGVKLSIGNQSFKIDYYGDREEAQWMKDMLIQAINNLITKTREETIMELEERESIKLVHEKAFNCPTLSIKCNHDFKFSHTEEENKIGSVGTTTGTMPPRLFDVVVCSKCGEIRKSLKYLTN